MEILGPFTSHRVIVDGRQVPFLDAEPANGGRICLTLDDRYGLDISVADAERIVPFIADCIAVALGYVCHPRPGAEPGRLSPFRSLQAIDWVQKDSAGGSAAGV